MSPDKGLSKIFGKFAGREIPMVETEFEIRGKKYPQLELADKNDPTLAEMEKVAENNGIRLRIWLPDTMGTCDHVLGRANVFVEQEADGKFRVQPKFKRG